jgi:putative Mg2+ transporter-C (MgtC) family protein
VRNEWALLAPLGLALLLSSAIGLEREIRAKSAGLRTHSLVGLASALIVLLSAYGFSSVLSPGHVVLDPSRVAAQVVSGIGFIGGGLIFIRRDLVRGLTTAATIWITAAVGMACGAGLPLLATATTAGHFLVVLVYPPLIRRILGRQHEPRVLRITYEDGRGVLRRLLSMCTDNGWIVRRVSVDHDGSEVGSTDSVTAAVVLTLSGRASMPGLIAKLSAVDGVVHIGSDLDEDADPD